MIGFIISGFYLLCNFYLKSTVLIPASGGNFKEGVIGQPRFINPIYLSANEADKDIVELLYSGLMKYNENAEITFDLASNYEIKENGKIWEVALKDNISWHDKKPITIDDVVFTIKIIQNPEYRSPLMAKWLGVEIEKISDKKIQFKLKTPNNNFLENLTLKIIPKHIFETIAPINLPWSLTSKEFLEKGLIGSGPFKIKKIIQVQKTSYIKSIILSRTDKVEKNRRVFNNENYHILEKPYLKQITFLFFGTKEDLIKNLLKRKIDGFLASEPKEIVNLLKEFRPVEFSLPRYFAIFFNQNQLGVLKEKEMREALAYSINKDELLQKISASKGEIIDSPILPAFYGFNLPAKIYHYDKEKAETILEKLGFKYIDDSKIRKKFIVKEPEFSFTKDLKINAQGEDVKQLQICLAKDKEIYPEGEITGIFGSKTKGAVIRFQEKYKDEILKPLGLLKGTGNVTGKTKEKLNQICFPEEEEILVLNIQLVTLNDPFLLEIANYLKESWRQIGVELEIITKSISELQTEIIEPRNFQMLLFGEMLTSSCDPLVFWHSLFEKSPGLNLAMYKNKKTDKLLEEARETLDNNIKKVKLEEFQNILIDDLPAIFLVNPNLVYFISDKISGEIMIETTKIVEPAKRFSQIENWYLKTKRVWK